MKIKWIVFYVITILLFLGGCSKEYDTWVMLRIDAPTSKIPKCIAVYNFIYKDIDNPKKEYIMRTFVSLTNGKATRKIRLFRPGAYQYKFLGLKFLDKKDKESLVCINSFPNLSDISKKAITVLENKTVDLNWIRIVKKITVQSPTNAVLFKKNDNIVFKWDKVIGAKFYNLTIYKILQPLKEEPWIIIRDKRYLHISNLKKNKISLQEILNNRYAFDKIPKGIYDFGKYYNDKDYFILKKDNLSTGSYSVVINAFKSYKKHLFKVMIGLSQKEVVTNFTITE